MERRESVPIRNRYISPWGFGKGAGGERKVVAVKKGGKIKPAVMLAGYVCRAATKVRPAKSSQKNKKKLLRHRRHSMKQAPTTKPGTPFHWQVAVDRDLHALPLRLQTRPVTPQRQTPPSIRVTRSEKPSHIGRTIFYFLDIQTT
jgi:hypothetical protein